MRTAARALLGLAALGVLVLLGVGLVEVAQKHGVWTALAIVPGMPVAMFVTLLLAGVAFGPDR